MALGDNLKKKKLIPEPTEEAANKKESKKKAPQKKATPSKSSDSKVKQSSAKKKLSEKKASPKKPISKKSSTAKKESPVSKKSIIESPKSAVEKVTQSQPLVVESPVQQQVAKQPHDISNPNQIISAYSVYIAKELYERKSALRKKYIEEIASLQGKPLQFIVLSIGSERYALDIDCVKEVVPLSTVSKTPNTPDHIRGVANVRGNTYVVFDLAAKFQVKGGEVPRYLLVLANSELKSSIPLSVLPTTFRTNGSQISHSLQMIENALLDASYIKGMIQDDEELIYYLDIEELLKNDKAIVVPDNLVEEK